MADEVNRVREATDLVALFRELNPGSSLQVRGKNYVATCPFHESTHQTASFEIDTSQGAYRCFDCGEKGNAVTLYQKSFRVNHGEALQDLADRAGIDIPISETLRKRKGALDALKEACFFFQDQLPSSEAEEYLKRRGINPDSIREFKIGYNPANRNALLNALGRVDMDYLIAAGLARVRKEDEREYGFFDGRRLMFPITDQMGRIVGFGGRTLLSKQELEERKAGGNHVPKYLNTQETDLFKKGRTLYGLDSAVNAIKANKKVIAFEGYTDVIRSRQEGIANTISTMGVAFTREHAENLIRMFPEAEIVLCLDGDKAGVDASKNIAEGLLGTGSLYVSTLPEDDPAGLLERGRKRDLEQALERREPVFDFLMARAAHGIDTTNPEGLIRVLRKLREPIKRMPLDRAEAYAEKIGIWFGITESSAKSMLLCDRKTDGYSLDMMVAQALMANINDPRMRGMILTNVNQEDLRVEEVRAFFTYVKEQEQLLDKAPLARLTGLEVFEGEIASTMKSIVQTRYERGILLREDILRDAFFSRNCDFGALDNAFTRIRMGAATRRSVAQGKAMYRAGRLSTPKQKIVIERMGKLYEGLGSNGGGENGTS